MGNAQGDTSFSSDIAFNSHCLSVKNILYCRISGLFLIDALHLIQSSANSTTNKTTTKVKLKIYAVY